MSPDTPDLPPTHEALVIPPAPEQPTVVVPLVDKSIKNAPAFLTAENVAVTRTDLTIYLSAATRTTDEIFTWLKGKNMSDAEIRKVLSDLDSYK